MAIKNGFSECVGKRKETGNRHRKLAVEQALRELLSGEWVADPEIQDIGHASWRRSDPLARCKRRLAYLTPGGDVIDRLARQVQSIDDNARFFCCIKCLGPRRRSSPLLVVSTSARCANKTNKKKNKACGCPAGQ
jgi:hypothetical protein